MSLTNKVAQFDADSDLINAWVHGPASGVGSIIITDSGAVSTPAKLIADKASEIDTGAQDVISNPRMVSYTALRAYAGNATNVTITSTGIAGYFIRSSVDVSADNGGTIIVDSLGRRWLRNFSGSASVEWFGTVGDGVTDDTAAIQAAISANPNTKIRVPYGTYKLTASVELAASQQIEGDGPASTIFNCVGEFDTFVLLSDYAGVSDCGFTASAARTASTYVKLSSTTRGNYVRRVRMTNAFIGVWVAADAVITYFEDIEFTNTAPTTGVGIWINGGNDTFLSRIVMDAPVGLQPLAGVRISRSQATWITDCDMIHQGCGIQMDPNGISSGLITWCFFSNVACDLGTSDGLIINPSNGATVKGLFFNNCWFSSNLHGINLLINNGGGVIDTVYFNNCTVFNNLNQGAIVQAGANIEFNNCRVSGNSQTSFGTYAGLEFANTIVSFGVRSTRSGAMAGFGNSQNCGLLIAAGCDQYVVTDNNFIGNITAGVVDNSQMSSGTREVRGNLGYKTLAYGVAQIAIGTNEIVVMHGLSGTPTVVLATPSNVNISPLTYWTGAYGGVTFNINTSANVAANSLFSWQASLYN